MNITITVELRNEALVDIIHKAVREQFERKILKKIGEIADEKAGTEIERINKQLNFMLDRMTQMGDRVVRLENTLRDIKYAIGTTIK